MMTDGVGHSGTSRWKTGWTATIGNATASVPTDIKSRDYVLNPVPGFASMVSHAFNRELGYLIDTAQL